MLGMCLNTFQVDLQADKEPPFPDIRGYGRVAPESSDDADGTEPRP